MSILKSTKLVKKYGTVVALDNVSLNIEKGEIFGLLGPNGAGKTTFINLITGLLKPNSGELIIFDETHGSNSNKIKQHLGIVPQDIAIYDDLTAYENVEFFAKLYGLRGNALKDAVNEALEFVGLKDKAKGLPKNFSGGMNRRLNIACAIAHRPKLIIMDEPTVGIDPQSRNHILQSVMRLNDLGCTIIYTSHYMEEVELISSRIGIIDNGKLIALGTKDELTTLISDRKRIELKVNNITDEQIEGIKNIKGVIYVKHNDNKIIIDTQKEIQSLDKIILYFNDNNISIINIRSQELNLEEVFLSLTGRSLRD